MHNYMIDYRAKIKLEKELKKVNHKGEIYKLLSTPSGVINNILGGN